MCNIIIAVEGTDVYNQTQTENLRTNCHIIYDFYMMLSTPHSRALGDAVFEEIRLKAWTDVYSGTHLTVIYFGVLFCVVLAISKKFLKVNKDVSKIHRIVVFVAAVIIIYLIHSTAVHKIM
jgi:hypothetical protein